MKGFLKFFVIAVMTAALSACNKVNNTNNNTTSGGEDDSDYSSLLPGHWSNPDADEYTTESLSFDSVWENSVVYQYTSYPGDDEYEINVRGTYSLSGSVITAQYNEMVSVNTYIDGVEGDSCRGFTDGVNKTVRYTIISCDGTDMVLTDDNGNRLNMHKYKTL